jgi:hypothetical protein
MRSPTHNDRNSCITVFSKDAEPSFRSSASLPAPREDSGLPRHIAADIIAAAAEGLAPNTISRLHAVLRPSFKRGAA